MAKERLERRQNCGCGVSLERRENRGTMGTKAREVPDSSWDITPNTLGWLMGAAIVTGIVVIVETVKAADRSLGDRGILNR